MGSCISKKSKSQLFKEKLRSSSLKISIREMKNQVLMNKVIHCPELKLYTNSKFLSRKNKKLIEKSPQTEASDKISWSL